MEIRMATVLETLEIVAHWKAVMSEATAGYLDEKQESELPSLAPFFYSDFDYLVCFNGDTIQGWVGIGEINDVYMNESKGFVSELYVLPASRNQGVGRKLCQEAVKRLSTAGYPAVQLNVFNGNHAKQLYEELGFTEVSCLMELTFE
ncbi:GNAT family N-acetyltransferase [Sporosarcina sp. A2]|uniref:GNAT family N-acetyltransferase n=1 Tax=Sporosarcina sp. A2 TaxID=3393449 RepID=UPI003D795EBA